MDLPLDVLNIILEYSGYHRFRNGKFIKQISKNDERYTILENELPKLSKFTTIYGSYYNTTFYKKINSNYYRFIICVYQHYDKNCWNMSVSKHNTTDCQYENWFHDESKTICYVYE